MLVLFRKGLDKSFPMAHGMCVLDVCVHVCTHVYTYGRHRATALPLCHWLRLRLKHAHALAHVRARVHVYVEEAADTLVV